MVISNYIVYNVTLGAGVTLNYNSLTIGTGAEIWVESSTGTVSFTALGLEVS